MRVALGSGREFALDFSWHELTGAIGDSVTVLPILVAVGVLTDLSLAVMLVWFGVFQIVWGLYYGAPISVEPMKALAALVIAGSITAGELVVAGLLLSGVLLALGASGSLARLGTYIDDAVVRGIQFGVALVLLETGVGLGLADLRLAGLAVLVALVFALADHWTLTAVAVLAVGGGIALFQTGVPTPALPTAGFGLVVVPRVTVGALEAAVGQLAMTVGNAALAAAVLMRDYFDREVSPDELAGSMGAMNLVAVPLGGLPMCHGSGGIAGKYTFGARTAAANLILGTGYLGLAVFGVGVVGTFPTAMLGVILLLIAAQLGRTGIRKSDRYVVTIGMGVLGLLVNLAAAFAVGLVVSLVWNWWSERGRAARRATE